MPALPRTVDAVIVGGGPGGLAAAHAITAAAPHLKVSVFERSAASLSGKGSARRGAGLGLDVNGQKALQAINPDLLTQVHDMASVLRSNRVLRPDGSLVMEVPMGQGAVRQEFAEQGYKTPCLLGWSELQQLLADTLPDSVTLHTGMEFERYEEASDGAGGITAYFGSSSSSGSAGEQQQQHMVSAQLLVAADGYFSRVRKQCLADGPPEWGSTLVYRARLPATAAAAVGLELVHSSIFVQDLGRFLFAYPISSGDVVWTVGVDDGKLLELGLDSSAIRAQLYAGGNSTTTTTTSTSSHDSSSNSGSSASKDAIIPSTVPAASKAGGAADATGATADAASGSDTTRSSSGSRSDTTRSSSGSRSDSRTTDGDYTQLQTQGYSPQEAAAGQRAKERCLQVLAGMSESVLQLVRSTPLASLVEHGVYTRPASSITASSFGKGRVVIIGDAAHPLRPTGQGLNQALEDAWGLGKVIQDSSCSSSAGSGGSGDSSSRASGCVGLDLLQAFREQRAKRMAPIVAFTTASGKAAYKIKKDAPSEEAAAKVSMGADTEEMTAQQFSDYCCCVEFSKLNIGA